MDLIIKIASAVTQRRNEEDKVDRLNFQYTSYAYVFSAVLIMGKQFMGAPLLCWTPAEFKGGWIQYTHDYCLIENTYWVPMEDPALPPPAAREKMELPYYQWVQFVLVLLAFVFMIPHFIWRSLNWTSGVQVRSIIESCMQTMGKPAQRETVQKKIAAHIYHSFEAMKSIEQRHKFTIMHIFLAGEGVNSDWKNTGLFPRSTMCDFEVRTKGNINRYSVQCVLSLNMFNEKIFAVLFIWLCILLCITIANTMHWLTTIYSTSNRRNLAVRMLKSQGIDQNTLRIERAAEFSDDSLKKGEQKALIEHESNAFEQFVELTPDQATVIRLITANAGEIVASGVVKELYNVFNKRELDN
ncbi:inx-15 [Pristionchus pacificus]|nr:inx-15 [Pristionchus pacificus]|eukprot:PDM67410.1 inx-15 [Pristionchus pacificus]